MKSRAAAGLHLLHRHARCCVGRSRSPVVCGALAGSAVFCSCRRWSAQNGLPSRFSLVAGELITLAARSSACCASRSAHRCCRRCSRGSPQATTSTSYRTAARSCSRARSPRSRSIALFAAGIITMYCLQRQSPFALDLVFQRAFAVSLHHGQLAVRRAVAHRQERRDRTARRLLRDDRDTGVAFDLHRTAVEPRSRPWIACALLWGAFAAAFLLAPRLKAPLGRWRALPSPRSRASYLPRRRRDRLSDRYGASVDARGRSNRARSCWRPIS